MDAASRTAGEKGRPQRGEVRSLPLQLPEGAEELDSLAMVEEILCVLEEKPLRILWTIAGVVVLGTINFWVADSKQAMMETVRILPTAAVDENRCANKI